MNALLYRAAEIGTIDSRRKSYLWMLMGQKGYRKHEPVIIPPESPSALSELLGIYRGRLGYSEREVGEVLCEADGLSEYRNMGHTSGFRLVK